MAGICFRRESSGWEQDQWSYLFSNFGVSDIWERGYVKDDFKIYQKTIAIDTAAELPKKRSLVVLAHPEGEFYKGVESLVDFVHPKNAIYMFGASNSIMSDEDDLGGREPDHLVYIPYKKCEMFSHAAGLVVLYDRLVKRGSFG